MKLKKCLLLRSKIGMARIYDTDLYIPKKSADKQKIEWFKAMGIVAKDKVLKKIKKDFNVAKTSLPFTVFVKIAKYNIELMYMEEYFETLKRYKCEMDTVLSKKPKYLSKIYKQNDKNDKIYGV
jgi:hypothetical protein